MLKNMLLDYVNDSFDCVVTHEHQLVYERMLNSRDRKIVRCIMRRECFLCYRKIMIVIVSCPLSSIQLQDSSAMPAPLHRRIPRTIPLSG